eukprot:Rhum_TRINITY_DN11050_c0_g1::Rhum_TRINITY_DN11050_c0_g1_i1::g.42078::m.42078
MAFFCVAGQGSPFGVHPAAPQAVASVGAMPYIIFQQAAPQPQPQPQPPQPVVQPVMMVHMQENRMPCFVRTASQGSSLVWSESAECVSEDSRCAAPAKAAAGPSLAPSQVLRVSGSTPVPGLAGAVANRLREGSAVSAEAMGPGPVAKMMRSLALAAEFLKTEGLRVSVQVNFMMASISSLPQDGSYPGLRFAVTHEPVSGARKGASQSLTVRESSMPGKSAGAIAKLARVYAPLRRTFTVCMTADPVAINTGTKALTLARKMIEEDHIDLLMYPVEVATSDSPLDPATQPVEILVCPHKIMPGQ